MPKRIMVARDVTCPVCHALPRENCKNTGFLGGGRDMGRIVHQKRHTVMLLAKGRSIIN